MQLAQLKHGYRYNTDTVLLADFCISKLKTLHPSCRKRAFRALDVGAGCGVLALMLARFLHSHLKTASKLIAPKKSSKWLNATKYQIDALDIQQINCSLIYHNAFNNAFKASAICSDIANFYPKYSYDLIICNPPFYHKLSSNNEHLATSRQAKFMPIEALFKSASRLIKPDGRVFICYEPSKLNELLQQASLYKLRCNCLKFVHSNVNKPASLVLLEFRKNKSEDLSILPPIITHLPTGPSAELVRIYEGAKLISKDFDEFNAM